MKRKSDYTISFAGLKTGHHLFDFKIDDAFFEELDYSLVQKGNIYVSVDLEKKETMLILFFHIEGVIESECNLCADSVDFEIKNSFKLIYKFGIEEIDDEAIVVIHPDSYQIDVTQPIYEFITVSLPARIIHKDGMCNKEMIESLNKYIFSKKAEPQIGNVDPRWAALKNLN
ncbi:MAG: DUF177 domain-containing protein [Bacteroidetes bacterium]|nr:DUF177 domain-containing protein [Bacteroidota bacterium]